jgi:hypothetical protein
MSQWPCFTAVLLVVYQPTATSTLWYKCCVLRVAVLDAADCGCVRVCNAVLLLCVTTVLTSMLSVHCSGVRSFVPVCLDVCVWLCVSVCLRRWLCCPLCGCASVWLCVAVYRVCVCVAH